VGGGGGGWKGRGGKGHKEEGVARQYGPLWEGGKGGCGILRKRSWGGGCLFGGKEEGRRKTWHETLGNRKRPPMGKKGENGVGV